MSNLNGNLLDAISMTNFILSLLNLNENLTQGDKQDLMSEFDNKTSNLLNEVHNHLERQDEQLKEILQKLGDLNK